MTDEPMQVVGGETVGRDESVEITPGLRLLLSREEGGRLAVFEFLGQNA